MATKMFPNIILTLTFLFSFSHEYQLCELQNPEVLTKYGPVRGSVEISRRGQPFYSFRGIPFAKPPVGNLRFKAPEPPDAWSEPLDATKEGPVCIQKNYFFANPKVEGQEDCLYINVYAPNAAYRLPVMVFIHWGGFLAGRATTDYIGPEYLMDRSVVLVTFNYRLGPLGFLTTLDDAAPGNYGLKDQVLAFRWVRDNIYHFGGDSSSVTIFGQSAGAASVHYHMLSPQSRGLFHKAISQSGNALAVWAALENNMQDAILAAQANFVGCGAQLGNSEEVISCLRNVSAYDLLESQDKFQTFHVDPLTVYTRVKETKTEANPEPFLTKNPVEYIQNGEFANVPWILGVVADEGLLKAEELLRQSDVRNDLNAKFETVFSQTLMGLYLSTNETKNLYEDIKAFYLLGKDYINISNPDSIRGFINVYSDRAFKYSAYQSAMLHAANGHKSLWFYHFDYRGQYSYGDLFACSNETIDYDWGTSHCDDLLYLFRSPGLVPNLKNTHDTTLIEAMTDMWTSFATYGDPNYSTTLDRNLVWWPIDIQGLNKMKNQNLCLLNIKGSHLKGVSFNTSCGFEKERMFFWSSRNLNENFPGLE